MYCILGLCFLHKGTRVREAGVGMSRERETLPGEVHQGVPAMGPQAEVREQRGEGSKGKRLHVSREPGD